MIKEPFYYLIIILYSVILPYSDAFSRNICSNIANRIPQKMAMSTENKSTEQQTIGQMLGGLVFLKTPNRESLVDFYINRINMTTWLEQPNISILKHGNMILGFHQIPENTQDEPDLHGMFTFVYPSIEQVDEMYNSLQDIADGSPRYNERYRIYQFFAKDPEGRNLEFQAFLHPLMEVSSVPMKDGD